MTHKQILESRYGDAEWLNEIVGEPIFPIEITLWHKAFNGEEDNEIGLPYQIAHIWSYLLDVGPVMSTGMGPVVLSYTEIQAWMSARSIEISSWEVALLRHCSQVWMSAQYEAKKPESIPPWSITSPEAIEDRRKRVAERLKKLGSRKGR